MKTILVRIFPKPRRRSLRHNTTSRQSSPSKWTEDPVDEIIYTARRNQRELVRAKLQKLFHENRKLVSTVLSQETQRDRSTTDPLAEAKQRGMQYMRSEWEKAESLTPQAAASYVGVSDHTITMRRRSQQIYALAALGKAEEFRYPQWQTDVDRFA